MRKFVLPTAIGSTIGAGLGMATNVIPAYWPGASRWFLGMIVWTGLTAFFVPLPSILIWHICEVKQARHIYGVGLLLFFWIFCYVIFSMIDRNASARWSQLPQPDVTLCLVGKKDPALAIFNTSDQTAESIKYGFALFDIDSAIPQEPLKIPTAVFDFVRPRSMGGPQAIFESTVGPSVVKDGDRIVGSIGISCPKCVKGQTFWISLIWGKGGWFSHVAGPTSGEIMVPFLKNPPTDPSKILSPEYVATLVDQVPESERIPIRDPGEFIQSNKNRVFSYSGCLAK